MKIYTILYGENIWICTHDCVKSTEHRPFRARWMLIDKKKQHHSQATETFSPTIEQGFQ